MDPVKAFKEQVEKNIEGLGKDKEVQALSRIWSRETNRNGYTYNYSWLSRPIIQYPQDIVAMQELIWQIRPDLIIETGIAHGGSLIFSASMLAMLDMEEAIQAGTSFDPAKSKRLVLGIDIDIRNHNRTAIESHAMFSRIKMIQGSSIASETIDQVVAIAKKYQRILVCLDSNHTHEHVLAELEAYAPLVSKGSYCVVFDTLIEDMPADMFNNRSWGVGNNPKTAVHEYLKRSDAVRIKGLDGQPLNFSIDKDIEHKLLITVAPDGYLKRI